MIILIVIGIALILIVLYAIKRRKQAKINLLKLRSMGFNSSWLFYYDNGKFRYATINYPLDDKSIVVTNLDGEKLVIVFDSVCNNWVPSRSDGKNNEAV